VSKACLFVARVIVPPLSACARRRRSSFCYVGRFRECGLIGFVFVYGHPTAIPYAVAFRHAQLIGANDPSCSLPSLERRMTKKGSWRSSNGSSYVISLDLSITRSRLLYLHGFNFWQATLKGQYTSRNEYMGSEKKCELPSPLSWDMDLVWSHLSTCQAS
jgi:hypothetical protein